MKKLFLSVIGMYFTMLAALSQGNPKTDSVYRPRKLTFEEANLVSSYYRQDGNNSAVTGGIGSEKLTDFSNAIDLKLYRYDKKNRKHSFTGELGIDHYTHYTYQVDVVVSRLGRKKLQPGHLSFSCQGSAVFIWLDTF